jgi:outer membrane protein
MMMRILALFFLSLPVFAEDLVQVYRDAKAYDAQYGAARHALTAGLEKLPQGRALILPTINLSGSNTRTEFESQSRDTTIQPSFERNFSSRGYTLSFSQPIFRMQNFLQYDQAGFLVKQAEAVFGQAEQDLILRVATAYFDVLAAQDSLAFIQAQKTAISEQLAQAKRNFEVGTATITDTHEAQARFDLSGAQEIAAQNDLDNKRRTLQLLTGKEYAVLKPLRGEVRLSQPNPSNMQSWVDTAEKQGYPVLIQDYATEIANLEAKRSWAAHLPTLDLVATHANNGQSASTTTAAGTDQKTSTIGLQLAVPIFAGGGISSRAREAAALYERSKQDLENARRTAALGTRQSFLAVMSGIAQVGALEAALVSSQSALDSNKLGYEVGVRINIDVLNAQQQLFSTRRDLAVARYNTITNHLRLKAVAGSLREEDLEEVNRALQP